MITGHLGIASAVQSFAPTRWRTPLFLAALAASVLPDIIDVLYAVTGICSPYGLYSHTVEALVLEAAVVGGVAYLLGGPRTSLLFTLIVLLHMPADFITMNKLAVAGGELVGLHVNARPALDFAVEVPLTTAAWWFTRRRGRAPAWAGSRITLAFLIFIQGAVDLYAMRTGEPVKPNACPVLAAPALSP